MDLAAADVLARKIASSWPGQPAVGLDVWADELIELREGTAGTALAQLRRELDRAPTIAQFVAKYRSLDTVRPDLPACQTCDSSGWITAARIPSPFIVNGHSHSYSSVEPCRCAWGERIAPGYRRTVRAQT